MASKTKKKVAKKAVARKSEIKSGNNFLLVILASCAILSIGLFMVVYSGNKIASPEASAPSPIPQMINWKVFEDAKYYFKFPSGMTTQIVLTEKATNTYLTPAGFSKTESKKVEVDGRVLDEVFYKSNTNYDLYQIRVIINKNDYLTYTEHESVEGRALLNDILSTFKFKN